MMTRPVVGSPANAAIALSIPALSCTVARTSFMPTDGAAVSSAGQKIEWGAVSGLNMTATRARLGTVSFRICSHLPAMTASKLLKPVMLPPGFERFVTRPSPIGSGHENDRNRLGRLLQRPRWGCVGAHDHVRSETDQFRSIRSDRRGITRAPTNVDADVAALCPLQVLEALAEGLDSRLYLQVLLLLL